MKSLLTALALTFILPTSAADSLFNGTDLTGWRWDAEGDFPYWTVKDGVTQHAGLGPENAFPLTPSSARSTRGYSL